MMLRRIVVTCTFLLIASVATAADHTPTIRGGRSKDQSQMVATYDGLQVVKVGTRSTGRVNIQLTYDSDTLVIDARAERIRVSRNGRTVDLSSPKKLLEAQALLGDSEAIAATRQLLSEQLDTSTLDAPQMSLLTAAAFAVSVAGDLDAPKRLADRFMTKHYGLVKVRQKEAGGRCWTSYSTESTASWNDMQACVDEANQDDNIFNRAYRRTACNGIWLARSESAWFEYLDCIAISGLGGLGGGK